MKAYRFLLLSFLLWSHSGQAQDSDTGNAQESGDCKTYTVINETANTSSTIIRCLNDSVVKPENEEPEPERAQAQSEENPKIHWNSPFDFFTDLDAQVSMAKSTKFIKKYTFWGLVIGTLGLFLLGWTLKATRDGAKAADRTADSAESAERAFLEVQCKTQLLVLGDMEIANIGELEIDANRIFSVNVYVFNYGKTPANISIIDITLVHEETQEEITGQFITENSEYKPVLYRSRTMKDIMVWPDRESYVYEAAWLPTFPYLAEHLYGGEIDFDDTSIKNYEKHRIAVKARVEYTSAFGEEREIVQLITFRPHIPIATEIGWMPDWQMDSARGSMVSIVETIMTDTTYADKPKTSKPESE